MILRILSRWEKGTHTLDFLTEQEFRRAELSSEERAEVTERVSIWGRGRGAARYLLGKKLKEGLTSLPPPLRRKLEVAVCRLLYEERTPKPIIVSKAVDHVKRDHGAALGKLANAVLRDISENPLPWPDAKADLALHLAHTTSHPPWIVKRWLERWGEERTRSQLEWNNRRPGIWLRWNRLKGNRTEATSALQSAQVDFEESSDFEYYFRLKSAFYPDAASLVQAGYFSIQDPSASLAVQLLDPRSGINILDLCAAPGGKTTLMAEMIGDSGRIVAVDSSRDRLKQLNESQTRLGISSVHTIVADGRIFAEDAPDSDKTGGFDAVLVDVPCSGFGVMGRRSDLRWRRKPEDLTALVTLQKELIRAGARCTKPGGVLVYSTCSIEPEENEEIVRDFLEEFGEFALDDGKNITSGHLFTSPGEINTYSPRDGVDGIYAARLIRRHSIL